MDKVAIPLEAPADGEGRRRRVFVVLEGSGHITAVDDGGEGWAALTSAGVESCQLGPPVNVGAEEYERYLREWGPTSKPWILRQAHEICRRRKTSLEAEAASWRFAKAGDREFAAAVRLAYCAQPIEDRILTPTVDGYVARLGRYLLRIDERGRMTVEQWQDVDGASLRVLELIDGIPAASN